jgi:hypothetical protein
MEGCAGVKDAVLGAVDELCIGDLQPSEAAERLANLADGSTLGLSPALYMPPSPGHAWALLLAFPYMCATFYHPQKMTGTTFGACKCTRTPVRN